MRKRLVYTLAAAAIGATVIAQDNPEISVKAMPPSVVKTIPQAGDTRVDPSIKEIRVTFSKDMMTDQMWSWCSHSRDTFPEADVKKIHYLKDKRTCVLPVKLRPSRTYVIWINSQQDDAFRDTENKPAIPYLLVFETGPQEGSSEPPDAPDGEDAAGDPKR